MAMVNTLQKVYELHLIIRCFVCVFRIIIGCYGNGITWYELHLTQITFKTTTTTTTKQDITTGVGKVGGGGYYICRRNNYPSPVLSFKEMTMMSTLFLIKTLSWIFIVLAHWINSKRVDISPYSDTLTWFRADQSLFLLFKAACYQISTKCQFNSL